MILENPQSSERYAGSVQIDLEELELLDTEKVFVRLLSVSMGIPFIEKEERKILIQSAMKEKL